VTIYDGLTGLAEYRNGDCFVDAGVLAFPLIQQPRSKNTRSPHRWSWNAGADGGAARPRRPMACGSGWLDATSMPLAKVLEVDLGGWPIAGARTPRGCSPPVKVISDGTVF